MAIYRLALSGLSICLMYIIALHVTAATNRPEQIHISYGASQNAIVVMWASREPVKGVVRYGNASDALRYVTESDVSTLPEASNKAAHYIHRAELPALATGSTYYYRVESLSIKDGSNLSMSETYSFKIPPKVQSKPMKFLVYGDMGAAETIPTYGQLEKHVTTHDYAAILHVGDFAYDLHQFFGAIGDQFLNRIQPFAARVPYMVCPGNHEISMDFQHYRTRFSTPGTPWPIPKDRMWHSFDIGLVHYVSYSTEVYFTDNAKYACTQYDWLLKDLTLANQNRDKTPWIIAIGHRPMYCSNANSDDCTGGLLQMNGRVKHALDHLFYAQGVDLVIQAHEHSYERLWPMHAGKVVSHSYVDPRAPTHIIAGAAGNFEGVDWMITDYTRPWSAFKADNSSRFSFGILDVYNSSHLHFVQVNAQTGHPIDGFWLQQRNHGPFEANVTCTGSQPHLTCSCPSPYYYIKYIVALVIVIISVLIFIIVGACWTVYCLKRRQQIYSVLPTVDAEMTQPSDVYMYHYVDRYPLVSVEDNFAWMGADGDIERDIDNVPILRLQ